MRRQTGLWMVCVLAAPVLLWANQDGALPRKTGGPFPAESVCSECHGGPFLLNRGPGSVSFTVQPYTPGQTQRITITVADPTTTQIRWGFQMSARPVGRPEEQAGTFQAVAPNSQVICDNDRPAPCGNLLQFPTHTRAGTRRGTRGSVSFDVDWTAPTANIGDIIFAAAGNAANGDERETGGPLGGDNIYTRQLCVTPSGAFVSVSSASFERCASSSAAVIAAGFGSDLATGLAEATSLPLPIELRGTRVRVADSTGTTRDAPLFFVSPGQINYLIPADTAPGTAQVTVLSGAGSTVNGTLRIDRVAPSIYAANAQGNGVAAALFLRVAADNTRTQDLIFIPDETRASIPVDLGGPSDQVFLLMFGTGIRGFSSPVTARVGDQNVSVLGAVAHPDFVGLDQVNIGPLPRSLAGRGEVDIILTVDGKRANTVKVNIR